MSVQSFEQKMEPYARRAAKKIHGSVHWQSILDQWALESGYGTSSLATHANNYAGIKYTSHADFKSGAYSGYNSIDSFVNDYARVLNLSYYNSVRAPGTIQQDLTALGAGPYAQDKSYGSKLESVNNNEFHFGTGAGSPAAGNGSLNWSSILSGLESSLNGKSNAEIVQYAGLGLLVLLATKAL